MIFLFFSSHFIISLALYILQVREQARQGMLVPQCFILEPETTTITHHQSTLTHTHMTQILFVLAGTMTADILILTQAQIYAASSTMHKDSFT